MNKIIQKICKKLGWTIKVYKEDIEIGQYSPAGEDFFFSVKKDNYIREILEYADNFDADEHAEMWIENMHSVNGVPQSIRTLIDDADEIKKMLVELADEIRSKKWIKI